MYIVQGAALVMRQDSSAQILIVCVVLVLGLITGAISFYILNTVPRVSIPSTVEAPASTDFEAGRSVESRREGLSTENPAYIAQREHTSG